MKEKIFNPFLPPWEYIADGEPRVFGERLYIFGSHDRFNGKNYCENDYVAWSAPLNDLGNWQYEGVIFRKDQTPWNEKLEAYFAPDVVQGPDGRFYLFYFVGYHGILSVAVCDVPAGKYQYLGDIRTEDGRIYGSSPNDWFAFDPSVLIDGGRIWLYAGSGQASNKKHGHPIQGCFVVELEPDMLTMKGSPRVVLPADWDFKKPSFWEGASARHIGEWYYLVYPTADITGLHYAMSRYPDRDFVHKGAIHSSSDIGFGGRKFQDAAYPFGNSHGGLVKVKDQWYIFDHRMSNGSQWNRQAVAEKVTFYPDGTISRVCATSCGLNDGPLPGVGIYPAYIACHLTGKSLAGMQIGKIGPCVTQDGEDYDPYNRNARIPICYIKRIKNGSKIGYKYFDLSDTGGISVRVRGGVGKLCILGSECGGVIAEIPICKGNEWHDCRVAFDSSKIKVNMMDQRRPCSALYFVYHGKGSLDFLEFELLTQ